MARWPGHEEPSGKTTVDVISAKTMAGAKERRETDDGKAFAVEAKKVILRLVDAAARAAVTADAAKAAGTVPVPPLSETGALEAAWRAILEDATVMDLGGKKSHLKAAIRQFLSDGELVEYGAKFGSTPGTRLRVRGGISGSVLDPVDLD